MYNHVRTLLHNTTGGPMAPEDFVAEEAISAEYARLELPTYLTNFRNVLFGVSPDRDILNYRLRQFMTLIHSTELEQYVVDLDPRITYDTSEEISLMEKATFYPKVTQLTGTAANFSILGDPTTPDSVGRMKFHINVDILTGATVEVKRLTPPPSSEILSYTLTGGLTNIMELGGTGYKFRMNTAATDVSWQVIGHLRPVTDLGSLAMTLSRQGEPNFLQLFGLEGAEPYKTFKALWYDHPELPYRLGGLLLAMAYRTEELRLGNNGES